MSFINHISAEKALWESTKTLKEVTRDRLALVKALKKYKNQVNKEDKRDYSRAIELVKPQNILFDLTESEINEAIPKGYQKLAAALVTSLENLLTVKINPTSEKELKIDYTNMSEAVSIILTVRFNNLNESVIELSEGARDFSVEVQKRAVEQGLTKKQAKYALRPHGPGITPCMKSKFFGDDEFVPCDKRQLAVLKKFYKEADIQPGKDLVMYDDILKKLGEASSSATVTDYLNDLWRWHHKSSKFVDMVALRAEVARQEKARKENEANIEKYGKAGFSDVIGGNLLSYGWKGALIGVFLSNFVPFAFGSAVITGGLVLASIAAVIASTSPTRAKTNKEYNQTNTTNANNAKAYKTNNGVNTLQSMLSKYESVEIHESDKQLLKLRKKLNTELLKLFKKRKYMK